MAPWTIASLLDTATGYLREKGSTSPVWMPRFSWRKALRRIGSVSIQSSTGRYRRRKSTGTELSLRAGPLVSRWHISPAGPIFDTLSLRCLQPC